MTHDSSNSGIHRPGLDVALQQTWERSRKSLSLIIVGICTVFFVVVAFLDLIHVVPRQEVFAFLGLSYSGVAQRHWLHEFLTAPLLHGSIAHLLFNMLSLWMLGPEVEKFLGRLHYLVFSGLCASCSMAGFLLANWGTGAVVMGYSGVIFGILVAQAVLFPNNVIAIFAFFPLKMKYAVLLLAAVELYLTLAPEDYGVAHAAHLFGAVVAFVYLQVVRRWDERKVRQKVLRARLSILEPARRRIGQEIPKEL